MLRNEGKDEGSDRTILFLYIYVYNTENKMIYALFPNSTLCRLAKLTDKTKTTQKAVFSEVIFFFFQIGRKCVLKTYFTLQNKLMLS